MLTEPRSGRLAAWGNALIAGLVSPDEAVHRVIGGDALHRMEGLPGETGQVGLSLGLGRLRALGVTGLRVALPVPGHPLGLSGPPDFNARALAAGEAVIATGGQPLGFVPEVVERDAAASGTTGPDGEQHVQVVWHGLPVRDAPPADVPSLGEAERELAEALRDATEALSRMDVAGSGPVAEAALGAYRARAARGREVLAPGYPPRAVRVLELAQRVGALIAIAYGHAGAANATASTSATASAGAGGEHGGAVSASQMAARVEALRPVERTARRAQVAAYNAYAEERGRH
jgi:hypothetical protein